MLSRGPNPATGIEVTDNLPAGLDFVSAAASQGAYDPATGAWSVGSLAVGEIAQLVLTAKVTAPVAITDFAVKTGQNEPDPITSNDSAAAVTTTPAADLAIDTDVDRRAALVGATLTFTVRATNRGQSQATGVTIADALPAGLSFVSGDPFARRVRHGDRHLDGRDTRLACGGDADAGGEGRPARRPREPRGDGVAGPGRSEPVQQQRRRLGQCRACGRSSSRQGREQRGTWCRGARDVHDCGHQPRSRRRHECRRQRRAARWCGVRIGDRITGQLRRGERASGHWAPFRRRRPRY